jgi:hypothetical protein
LSPSFPELLRQFFGGCGNLFKDGSVFTGI